MDVRGKRLRRFAAFAIIGVFLAFSAAWANGIFIPGGLPGTGIDWLITAQSNVLTSGGNGELGLHVTSGLDPALDDDDDGVEVYGYKVGTLGEFPLDGNNLLMVRTHWNSVALENVTVSNDSSETFELSNLEIIPDWGTFTGFDTSAGSQGTGNWAFNVTHRGFHTLLDPESQEPLPFVLAKVEKDTNFVELAYNPFGEPVSALLGSTSLPSSGLQAAAGLETLFYPLPRRYATSGIGLNLGTVFFDYALIPATTSTNFDMAITNWGSEPISIPLAAQNLWANTRTFFLISPMSSNYSSWLDGSPASRDLPPAFSFGMSRLCDAYLEGDPLQTRLDIDGTLPGESATHWTTSFKAKAYRYVARFTEKSMEPVVMTWDGLDLVHFTIPSADLEGKNALYPHLLETLSAAFVGDYGLDPADLVVSHDEGPVDGFAGDVRFLEMDVPYGSLVPVAEGETVPVLPLRIRMDLTTEGSEDLPEAVADAIQAIAEDVADDIPFDQAFLERFHIWAVLSDGQIVDLVEAAEEAELDPTNVIRLMGTALQVPGGITTTQLEEATTVLYCRGQLFGAVVDDGPAGVSFSNGAVIIHDGGNTGDPAFTAKIVLAPVTARETPENGSGGGCNGAGALPLGLFLLVPVALLRSRR
jgi:hypothetical protein